MFNYSILKFSDDILLLSPVKSLPRTNILRIVLIASVVKQTAI